MKPDVIVIGGGSAGIAASIMSARSGAKTLLVERFATLGGMASTALVHTVCGLYLLRNESGAEYAHKGFPREFGESLRESGASPGPVRMGKLDVLPFAPTGFASLADRLCFAEKNLTVRFHSQVTSVDWKSDSWEVGIACCGNHEKINAAAIVDCSGDAVGAQLAGLPFEITESNLQRPAYVTGLQGFPEKFLTEQGKFELARAIVTGIRDELLPREAAGAGFRSIGRPGEAFCTIDLRAQDSEYDPTDPDSLTYVEQHGRDLIQTIVNYLRFSVDELESLYISQFPARAGIRESRRVVTQHMLTEEELLEGIPMEDGVAVSSWPIESREDTTGPKWKYPVGESPVKIPLRSLRSAKHDHYFVAGRCLGATHYAQAAIRVMGTCFATGAASGVAAALVAKNGSVSAGDILEVYEP